MVRGCDPKENNTTGRQWSTFTERYSQYSVIGGRKVYGLMIYHVTLIIANDKGLFCEKFILCSLL